MAKELKSLKLWQTQENLQKEKEIVEGEKYIASLRKTENFLMKNKRKYKRRLKEEIKKKRKKNKQK